MRGPLRWWRVNRRLMRVRRHRHPCGAMSGSIVGFPCELPYKHDGRHEATTSVTTDNLTGREIGRSVVHWESPK